MCFVGTVSKTLFVEVSYLDEVTFLFFGKLANVDVN